MKHVTVAAGQRRQQRQERDARRGRLGKGRYDLLVKEMAGAIRLAFEAGATATLFGLEGPLREAIRCDLCLQGWCWVDADAMAREMLDRERAQAKEWPTDPMAAIREAQRAGGAHVSVKLNEPVKLAIATMVIAGVVLQYQYLDTLESGALQSVLEVSESALRAWDKQQDEMSVRLRAITNPRV